MRPSLVASAPAPGISVWFEPGNTDDAKQLIAALPAAGLTDLRIPVSREHWQRPGGAEWFAWLAGEAASDLRVTVALYRFGSEALEPGVGPTGACPPAWVEPGIDDYCAFVEAVIETLGAVVPCFELADPLGSPAWPDLAPQSVALVERVRVLVEGAPGSHELGLGGLPLSVRWLELADASGVLSAAALLAFTGAADSADELAEVLARARACADVRAVWLTPPHATDLRTDPAALQDQLGAGASRVYLDASGMSARRGRPRGLSGADGRPLLFDRLLRSEGTDASMLAQFAELDRAGRTEPQRGYSLVIGGAGFVGTNLTARLARAGEPVLVFDDLSRAGTERNLQWLVAQFPDQVRWRLGDVRDAEALRTAVAGATRVFHLAAQVAVTTSLEQPLLDHDVNVLGTLNVLEAVRACSSPPALVFTSTNKVYGDLEDVALRRAEHGYEPVDDDLRAHGISEQRPLSFCSPYGCSKGSAEQYVLDYARTFGLPAVVLRMSCIYGPHQYGNEDQGWVAHFARRLVTGGEVTFYGDGYQVRDVLYVEDLVEALLLATRCADELAGEAFNMGGGPGNAVCLRGLVEEIRALGLGPAVVCRRDWRPSDQRYYVSDTRRFQELTGWRPSTSVSDGVRALCDWIQQDLRMPAAVRPQGKVAL